MFMENDIGSHGLTIGKSPPNDSIAAIVGLASIVFQALEASGLAPAPICMSSVCDCRGYGLRYFVFIL